MKLLVSAVCDEAAAEEDGKITLKGVFHDLYAPGFPAKQDQMVLVLVLEWSREDHGRYDFKADLMGPDGNPTLSVQGQSEVEARPADRPPARTQVVMPMEDVIFPIPGEYVFQVQAKGRKFRGPTLYLIETEDAGEAVEA
jgi:hypothetical protein